MYNDGNSYSNHNAKPAFARDGYGALVSYPAGVKALVEQVRDAVWATGMRGCGYESCSIEVYGYDEAHSLAVVKIYRAWRKDASWATETEISTVYAMVGITDDGQVFSHPMISSARCNPRLREMEPEAVVRWAESKIFGVPVDRLGTLIQRGDITLVPVCDIPQDATPSPHAIQRATGVRVLTLCDNHDLQVNGEILRHQGSLYVKGMVEVVHAKHARRVLAGEGTFEIVMGIRADSPAWLDPACAI
ncbi:hypothetical protein [Acidithiobacillus sp.]|uniref:hypothetical protein n=1 Tax=Acidithiobacillus sp. TaxID=1872118 RepID=UPI003CFD5ABA